MTDGSKRIFSQSCGLTKREFFAAMAMQGLLAAEVNPDEYFCDNEKTGKTREQSVAEAAYKQADAMIAASGDREE
jgi:hypothetical protein